MRTVRSVRTTEVVANAPQNPFCGDVPQFILDGHPDPVTIPTLIPSFETHRSEISGSARGKQYWHSFSHYTKDMPEFTPVPIVHFGAETLYVGRDDHLYRWRPRTEFSALAFPSSFGPLDEPTFGLDPMYGLTVDGEFIVNPPFDLEVMLQDALNRVMPGIKQNVSVLNSTYELKDMKTLLHSYSSIRDTYRRLVGYRDSITKLTTRRQFGKLTLKEVGRRSASEYLQYKFNLAPLYSDIQSFYKTLRNYKSQLNRLLSQSDKVNRRHVTFDLLPAYYAPEEVDDWNLYNVRHGYGDPYYIRYRSRRGVEYEPLKCHVEVEYTYTVPEYERLHGESLSIMDSLGVNLNPAILWNAYPWTFALDWVLPIGKYLDRFAVRGITPVINIRRCLWSIKRTRHIRMSVDADSASGLPSSRVSETAYRRSLFTPTMSSLRVSGLSSTEVSLGASLAITRAKPLKRAHIVLPHW